MRLFNYEPVGETERHTVFKAESEQQAKELVDSGKAIKLELSTLDELEKKAEDVHAKYKKAIRDLKESDNPLIRDNPDVIKYEMDKIDVEYRTESASIEDEYTSWRSKQIDEATRKAARAVIDVTEKDRSVSEQFISRASLKLATANENEKGAVMAGIIADISHLNNGEKVALQGGITPLLSEFDSTSKRSLVSAVQDIRSQDILGGKIVRQLPVSVLTSMRREDALKDVVKGGNR